MEMIEQNIAVPEPGPLSGMQHAGFEIRIGERASLRAEVSVTSVGLLSIGALVSSVLLSTAVVVRAARGGGAERRKDLRKRDRDALCRM